MQTNYTVTDDNDTVVGQADLTQTGDTAWTLDSIHVDPEARSLGHGATLLTAVGADGDLVGVTITLTATPGVDYTWNGSKQLLKWFGRHGWVSTEDDPFLMVRDPQPIEP